MPKSCHRRGDREGVRQESGIDHAFSGDQESQLEVQIHFRSRKENIMKRPLDTITLALVIIGALNWLLVGGFKFDLVATIVGRDFGEVNVLSRIIYIIVGLSGIYQISNLARVASEDTVTV